jgi:hypothetical protein
LRLPSHGSMMNLEEDGRDRPPDEGNRHESAGAREDP